MKTKELAQKLREARDIIDKCLMSIEETRSVDRVGGGMVSTTATNRVRGNTYAGPKGGITLLFEKGYFKSKRSTQETKSSLEKEGYHYKRQVIQTTLNRMTSKSGSLVAMLNGATKVYVERK